ncbi:MAG: hypothetical protein WKF73_02280 [Nocardioidaceae bacterium]
MAAVAAGRHVPLPKAVTISWSRFHTTSGAKFTRHERAGSWEGATRER